MAQWLRSPAVVVHGLADARAALAPGQPVTLLSGEAAALYAGCGWWRALVAAAARRFPAGAVRGHAGLRRRLRARRWRRCASACARLILWPDAPGRAAVAAIVAGRGGVLLAARPPALDLADAGQPRAGCTTGCRCEAAPMTAPVALG